MGYVYKYTHKETGKWYIGSTKGNNPKYSGSGLLWVRAKKKYGLDSFNKELLYEGDLYREMEGIILTFLDAKADPMSYNMKNQALGVTLLGEENPMYGREFTPEHRYKLGNAFRGKKRPDFSAKITGSGNPMYGRSDHVHGIVTFGKSITGKTLEEIYGNEKGTELRSKLSSSQLGKKHNLEEKQCPHCNLIGSGPNMVRYHFDNCKQIDWSEEEKKKYNEQKLLDEAEKLANRLAGKRPKQSLAMSGSKNPMFGTKRPQHVLDAVSKAHKGKPAANRQENYCVGCQKRVSKSRLNKYHGKCFKQKFECVNIT